MKKILLMFKKPGYKIAKLLPDPDWKVGPNLILAKL